MVFWVDGKKTAIIKPGVEITFTVGDKLLLSDINGKNFSAKEFTFTSADSSSFIQFDGKQYRGVLKFTSDGSSIYCLNYLLLDEYLRGVIAPELGKNLGKEYESAIRAFSVVARTYAVNRVLLLRPYYDVAATVADQVYGGLAVENSYYNEIIEQTAGDIITYGDSLAIVYYSSCCGGISESAENIFTKKAYPYLSAKSDGEPPNCTGSASFAWEENYTSADFSRFVGKTGNDSVYITSVEITKRFPSGRVAEIVTSFSDSGTITLKAQDIRQKIRRKPEGGILRSLLFDISVTSDSGRITEIRLTGNGNGHGVGLCQWGMFGLSKQGASAEQIIGFYFPGTEIRKFYGYPATNLSGI